MRHAFARSRRASSSNSGLWSVLRAYPALRRRQPTQRPAPLVFSAVAQAATSWRRGTVFLVRGGQACPTLCGMQRFVLLAKAAAAATWAIHKTRIDAAILTERRQLRHMACPSSACGARKRQARRSPARYYLRPYTGSAWKLPPEMTSFGGKTSGLPRYRVGFSQQHSAAWRICVRQAPITCIWHCREYGSCTLSLWCDCEIALSSVSRWRYKPPPSSRLFAGALHDARRQTDDVSPAPLRWLTPLQTCCGRTDSRFEQTAQGKSGREGLVPLSSQPPSFAARVIGSQPYLTQRCGSHSPPRTRALLSL